MRRLCAFLLVFGILSWTVAAISAAVYADDTVSDADDLAAVAAGSSPESGVQKAFKPRLSAPSSSNPYYYSDKNIFYEYGWGMPNCTCYAWGRAYELLGEEPRLCVYSAHLWYDYNRENHYYPYGDEPKLGAIACWMYSSGCSGHVAVVEKIEDGKITFSNSAYCGVEFYTDTVPVDDPSDGRDTWIFQGYIYIGDFAAPESSPADKPSAGQSYRITSGSGVNVRNDAGLSGQIVGWLPCDQVVTVTQKKVADGFTWGYMEYDGMTGWFALENAEPVEPADPPADPEPDTEPLKSPGSTGGRQRGDVDGDGAITILDATAIQRILTKLVAPTDAMLSAGDVDEDGLFTILDANRIQCILVNLP